MKSIHKGLQVVVILLLVGSCSTDKSATTTTTTEAAKTAFSEDEFKKIIAGDALKAWKIQQMSRNLSVTELSACEKEERIIFKSDNSIMENFPEGMDCPHSSVGNWSFNPKKNKLLITYPDETNEAILINAADSKIEIKITDGGDAVNLILLPAD